MIALIVGGVFAVVLSAILALVLVRLSRREEAEARRFKRAKEGDDGASPK